MGFVFSQMIDEWLDVEKIHILMVGLDCTGKTTILNKLNLGNVEQSVPLIGFNVETLTVWDIAASAKIKQLQQYYFQDIQALTFVIDSTDNERIELVKLELEELLNQKDLKACPLLILANKLDIGVMSLDKIAEHLQLQQLQRQWYIQGTCALTGDGLSAGFDWLAMTLKSSK